MHARAKTDLTTEKLAYSIPEAAALLSIGKTTLYELMKAKRLDVRKCGDRTLITAASLQKLLDELPTGMSPWRQAEAVLADSAPARPIPGSSPGRDRGLEDPGGVTTLCMTKAEWQRRKRILT